MNILLRTWHRYHRWIDSRILWPPIAEQAIDREHALTAFYLHMRMDTAYSDMSEHEKQEFLGTLLWRNENDEH